jgi:hypothetical protein
MDFRQPSQFQAKHLGRSPVNPSSYRHPLQLRIAHEPPTCFHLSSFGLKASQNDR